MTVSLVSVLAPPAIGATVSLECSHTPKQAPGAAHRCLMRLPAAFVPNLVE
jgi:hypothetical protein